VTSYAPSDDKRRMFSLPRYVIKAGAIVLDDGQMAARPRGVPHVAPIRPGDVPDIEVVFSRYARSVRYYPVTDGNVAPGGVTRDRGPLVSGRADETARRRTRLFPSPGGQPSGHHGDKTTPSPPLEPGSPEVDDTFAEAFPMTAARAIVTADSPSWAAAAGGR
jgi:hypothetical protein